MVDGIYLPWPWDAFNIRWSLKRTPFRDFDWRLGESLGKRRQDAGWLRRKRRRAMMVRLLEGWQWWGTVVSQISLLISQTDFGLLCIFLTNQLDKQIESCLVLDARPWVHWHITARVCSTSREGGTGLMLLLLIHSFIHTGDQTKKTDFYSCSYSFKIEY